MGEILGVGLTHFPAFLGLDDRMATALRHMLGTPGFPASQLDPANWPAPMREEWGQDEGIAAAGRHRLALIEALRKVRRAIDEFHPDAIVVMGDDQYENFREDLVPPFCLLAYEDMEIQPWKSTKFGPNPWGEPDSFTIKVSGNQRLGKSIVEGLLGEGIDMSYAYRPRHHAVLPHAFLNAVLYLDYDRRGFDYPVIPIAVNCYGRSLISNEGVFPDLESPPTPDQLDPPSPHPWRCFDLGGALARVLSLQAGRFVVAASASWSHSFLCPSTGYLHPAVEADRRLFEQLSKGEWSSWRQVPLESIEHNGHHELLNWMVLAGAMAELGAKPSWSELVETYVFNSDKAFAIIPPADEKKMGSR